MKSALIASEVLNIREVVEAEHILVYLSIDETREVYTGELVSGLLEAGKRLSVPVVDQRRLLAVRYEPGQNSVAAFSASRNLNRFVPSMRPFCRLCFCRL